MSSFISLLVVRMQAIVEEMALLLVCLWISRTNEKTAPEISLHILNALYKELKCWLGIFFLFLLPPLKQLRISPCCISNMLLIVLFPLFWLCNTIHSVKKKKKSTKKCNDTTVNSPLPSGANAAINAAFFSSITAHPVCAQCDSVWRGHLFLCRCQLSANSCDSLMTRPDGRRAEGLAHGALLSC